MLRKMKLGQKIALGFGITLTIMLLIGAISWVSLKKQSLLSENAREAGWLTSQIFESQIDFERYLRTEDQTLLDESREETNNMKVRSQKLIENLQVQEQIKDAEEVVALRVEWFGDFENFVSAFEKLDQAEETMVTSSSIAVKVIDDATTEMKRKLFDEIQAGKSLSTIEDRVMKSDNYTQLEVNMLNIRILVLRFMKHHDVENRDAALQLFQDSYRLGEILKTSHSKQADKNRVDEIVSNMKKYENAFAFYAKEILTHNEHLREMAEDGKEMVAVSRELQNDQEMAMNKAMAVTNSVMLIFILGGSVAGVAFAVIITLGITRPINSVISGLSSGSENVTNASDQVSSSSQSLAQGASEQAASLEEISSSLDEITSMTKQSSENAQNANVLMQEALVNTMSGKEAMGRLNFAIQEIRESTDKTSSVIKSIEEIAFQTNLLALNAAVEAARAGEAGKGFAVVAEEVRNLAQRAAEAAKDTTVLIESSKKNAENGELISQETGSTIESISASAEKVAALVEDISTAAHEQATGIDQVNIAVSQMSEVTQSNAAGAEEFASASVELSSQSESLKDIINDLIVVVHGDTFDGHSAGSTLRKPAAERDQAFSRKAPVKINHFEKKNAEEIIPFNDGYGEY